MANALRLMCVLAHPDDESFGTGSTLAKYSAEGIELALVTATRGERGWTGAEEENPGLATLGALREGELRAACGVLGISDLSFLDYIDGELDKVDTTEATAKIVREIRRFRPQVLVTFGPDGAYGHPDHIAISQLTAAAVLCAADTYYADPAGQQPFRVDKLYYFADDSAVTGNYEAFFGELVMLVNGAERRAVSWPDWSISARIDATEFWKTAWDAAACHRSQLPSLLYSLTEEQHRRLWGVRTFYRVLSLVNGGQALENDLFAGLR